MKYAWRAIERTSPLAEQPAVGIGRVAAGCHVTVRVNLGALPL